jgi:hypothetical protein
MRGSCFHVLELVWFFPIRSQWSFPGEPQTPKRPEPILLHNAQEMYGAAERNAIGDSTVFDRGWIGKDF